MNKVSLGSIHSPHQLLNAKVIPMGHTVGEPTPADTTRHTLPVMPKAVMDTNPLMATGRVAEPCRAGRKAANLILNMDGKCSSARVLPFHIIARQ